MEEKLIGILRNNWRQRLVHVYESADPLQVKTVGIPYPAYKVARFKKGNKKPLAIYDTWYPNKNAAELSAEQMNRARPTATKMIYRVVEHQGENVECLEPRSAYERVINLFPRIAFYD